MSSRPIHFQLTAEDPERMSAFYGTVFGWSFEKWDGPMEYWTIETGPCEEPGINGGVTRRQPGQQAGTVNSIGVASVDAALAAATAAGGTVVMPKMAIPGMGYLAFATDCAGNYFGMMEQDEAAV